MGELKVERNWERSKPKKKWMKVIGKNMRAVE